MTGLTRSLIAPSLTTLCLLLASPLGATTIRVPADQPTIQAGLDAAAVADTVLVAPGTYTGLENRDLDFAGKDLVLLSEGGAQVTTIDCQQLGRGFFLHGGETNAAVIEGFTIRNGLPGGVEDRGGAILCVVASPTIQRSVIIDNQATAGGGIFLILSDAEISDNTISDNVCDGSLQEGGGGIACVSATTARIAGNTVIRNRAGAAGGGGIFLSASSAAISDNLISDNEAEGAGGGIECFDGADATIMRNVLCENRASEGGGIAFSVSGPTIADNLICENESLQGGGIFCGSTSTGSIEGNTIVENASTLGRGGGIHCLMASPAVARNIIAFSTEGRGIQCSPGSSPGLSCNDLFGNQLGDGLCGNDLGGNFSADPLFCDQANGDYTLFETSPCLPGQHPGGANCGLIGALGQGCGPTAIEPTTWGAIKAGYQGF